MQPLHLALLLGALASSAAGKGFGDGKPGLLSFGASNSLISGTEGTFRQNYIEFAASGLQSLLPQHFLSSKIIQNAGSTWSGGPVIPQYLTQCGLKGGETSPKSCDIELWSFASAGAHVVPSLTLPNGKQLAKSQEGYSITEQVDRFIHSLHGGLEDRLDQDHTMTMIWAGVSDLMRSRKLELSTKHQEQMFTDLQDIVFEQVVQPLYEKGWKNMMLVNLTPLEILPNLLKDPKQLWFPWMTQKWNKMLQERVEQYQAEHRDAKIVVFDAHATVLQIKENPRQYGLKDTTGFCKSTLPKDLSPAVAQEIRDDPKKFGCHRPDEYLFWDIVHMGTHIHKQIAAEMRKVMDSHFEGVW